MLQGGCKGGRIGSREDVDRHIRHCEPAKPAWQSNFFLKAPQKVGLLRFARNDDAAGVRYAVEMKPVRTEEDDQEAMAALATLWGAVEGSPESDQLDILATLIEKYEAAQFPMDLPDLWIRSC